MAANHVRVSAVWKHDGGPITGFGGHVERPYSAHTPGKIQEATTWALWDALDEIKKTHVEIRISEISFVVTFSDKD